MKTAGRLRVSMPKSGELDYEFKHGISTTVSAPGQPINVAQALEFDSLGRLGLKRWKLPWSMVPAAPRVLEVMPGESTIRQRDEEKRQREEREAHQRRLSEAYREQQAEIRRLRLERCLNWANSDHQRSLPTGSDPAARNQLTGDRNKAYRIRMAQINAERARLRKEAARKKKEAAAKEAKVAAREKADVAEALADVSPRYTPDSSGTTDPWDSRYVPEKVNWDHDLEVDPPPF